MIRIFIWNISCNIFSARYIFLVTQNKVVIKAKSFWLAKQDKKQYKTEAVPPRCSWKKALLNISQNSKENTFAGVTFQ